MPESKKQHRRTRPIRNFTISPATDRMITVLSRHEDRSRSGVVDQAVAEMAKNRGIETDPPAKSS